MTATAIDSAESSRVTSLHLSPDSGAGDFMLDIEGQKSLTYAMVCIREGNYNVGIEVSTEIDDDMEFILFQKMRQEYYLQKGFWRRYSIVGLKGAQAVEVCVRGSAGNHTKLDTLKRCSQGRYWVDCRSWHHTLYRERKEMIDGLRNRNGTLHGCFDKDTPEHWAYAHERTQFVEEQFERMIEVNFDMPYCALTNSTLRNSGFLRNKSVCNDIICSWNTSSIKNRCRGLFKFDEAEHLRWFKGVLLHEAVLVSRVKIIIFFITLTGVAVLILGRLAAGSWDIALNAGSFAVAAATHIVAVLNMGELPSLWQ